MSRGLRLADGLMLPVEAATQTFLIVGKRGSGKTSTAVRLAEQLIKADVPIVVVDPVDRWHGLKASRDGQHPGLSVYVFGGEHADLPLEAGAGAVIADTLVDHRISAVLSVKHFSGRERGRFVSDLAGRLFQRNKEPLHVFLEEAHEVAPQQPFKGEEEMVGRVTRLWKLGRSSGIGGSAITQRPASLSKNITTQAEILIVHRMIGPQDVAAVREWIRYHGERDDILGELATLKTGECFIWAPDFPEGKPIGLKRVQILDRETFDSSATPKVGQRAAEPKELAPVDLEKLRTRMQATIEKAKAEDPREFKKTVDTLRATIRTMEHELARRPSAKEQRVEVPILKDAQVKRLEVLFERMIAEAMKHGKAMAMFWEHQEEQAKALLDAVKSVWEGRKATAFTPAPVVPIRAPHHMASTAKLTGPPAEGLDVPRQRILDTVAMLGVRGIRAGRDSVARWMDLHPTGGRYGTNLGFLRAEGYLDGFVLTERGQRAARVIPTGLEAALEALSDEPKRQIIRTLIDAGKPLSRDQLAEALGLHPTGGRYGANLGWLRTMGLLTERGPIAPTEGLYR